jgi:hypothetical protein
LGLCWCFIWLLLDLQPPQHICFGIPELYVHLTSSILFIFINVSETTVLTDSQSFVAPKEHHLKVKPRKVQDIEYKDQFFGGWRDPIDRGNLPFQPLSLVFSQISYFVDMPRVSSLYYYFFQKYNFHFFSITWSNKCKNDDRN